MCAAQRHDKVEPVLLVLEEQVLGVPAGQLALEPGAFGHREHRLVLDGGAGNAELVEPGEQVLAGGWHGVGALGRDGCRSSAARYISRRRLAIPRAALVALQRSPSCCIRPAIGGRCPACRPAWTRV